MYHTFSHFSPLSVFISDFAFSNFISVTIAGHTNLSPPLSSLSLHHLAPALHCTALQEVNGFYDEAGAFWDLDKGYFDDLGAWVLYPEVTGTLDFMV